MTLLSRILVLAAAAVIPHVLSAQRVDSLVVGAQLRVDRLQPERKSIRGTYTSLDSVKLVIAALDGARDLIELPLRDIGTVELLTAVRPSDQAFLEGAKRGALIGLGIGAVLVTLGALADSRTPGNCGDCFISGTGLAVGASLLIIPISTLIGGASGAAGREKWVEIPLRR